MNTDVACEVADLLGALLRRNVRAAWCSGLTDGLDEALDELTYPVIIGLSRSGPCSAADLAEEIGLDRSGVSRRATRLEQAGLLGRRPSPTDRRAVVLELTEAGAAAVELMRARLADRVDAALPAGWSREYACAFTDGLRRLAEPGATHGAPNNSAIAGPARVAAGSDPARLAT